MIEKYSYLATMGRAKKFGKRKHTGNRYTVGVKPVSPNEQNTPTHPRPTSPISNDESTSNKSCSKTKLKYLTMVGDKTDYVKTEMEEGNIIVDLEILSKELMKFVACRSCFAEGSVKLFEATDERKGIVSNLVLLCTECSATSSFFTSKKAQSSHFDSNIRLVYGMRSIGKGQAAAETLLSIMNLPPPPTKFYHYNSLLLKSLRKVTNDSMIVATREAIAENDHDSDICVAFDGTWQKRGHTSLHGVITATSLDTGKVLDFECLSKYCPTCRNEKKNHTNCQANHVGSSGSMEVAGVTKLFERSTTRGVAARYIKYLGDGDSKGFDSVAASNPYGQEVVIEKVECINHVQKRMGTRLRRLVQMKVLPDGKKLSGRGRLTDKVINELQQYYGSAIRGNDTLEEMKHACWATFYHKASTDADPQHTLCPIGAESWCKYNRAAARGLPCPEHNNSLLPEIMAAIKPVYKDLCQPSLLKKCLLRKTQNCNEAFNHIIWSRLPKTEFVNAQTIQIGVLDAVLCYNDGVLGRVKVLQELCGQAGPNCVIGLQKKDFTRVRKAELSFQEIEKRARKARKTAKRRLEEVEKEEEATYGAGMF